MLTLTYEVICRPGTAPDTAIQSIENLIRMYARDPRTAKPEVSHSTRRDSSNRIFITVRIDNDEYLLSRRGIGGIMPLMLGQAFRDEWVENVHLNDIFVDSNDQPFRGPRYGATLVEQAMEVPTLSTNIPRSVSDSALPEVVSALSAGGISIFSDLAILAATPSEVLRRAHIIAKAIPHARQSWLFFNITSNQQIDVVVSNISSLQESIGGTLRLGIRLCPVSMGFPTLERVRHAEVPVFAFTSQVPMAYTAWSTSAYGGLVSALGADLANVGLDTDQHMTRGELKQAVSSMQRTTNGRPPTIPVFTGSIDPYRAHRYSANYGRPLVLHALTFIYNGGREPHEIYRRTKALSEAVALGNGGTTDLAPLFASRDRRVANWQALMPQDRL